MSPEAWNAMPTILFVVGVFLYMIWSRWLDYKSTKNTAAGDSDE